MPKAARLLMGTLMEMQMDSDYNFIPFVERAAAYLTDLHVRDIDYSCMSPGIDSTQFRIHCERSTSNFGPERQSPRVLRLHYTYS